MPTEPPSGRSAPDSFSHRTVSTSTATGNVWVTDCACTLGRNAAAEQSTGWPSGLQVQPRRQAAHDARQGGRCGRDRVDSDYFYQPNDVLVAPNGDIYVAEGHSSAEGSIARIRKFSKDGKLIATWGKFGKGPDDYDQPHALAMDSKGRLFVGDRGNNRIKILDQSGKLLDTWYQFSRPSGIYIDKQDRIYVADSESGSVAKDRDGLEARHSSRQRKGRQRSRRSFRTQLRTRRARVPRRAWRSMRRATFTERKSALAR